MTIYAHKGEKPCSVMTIAFLLSLQLFFVNNTAGGSLEFDPFAIYEKAAHGDSVPKPLSPTSSIVSAATRLFGVIFSQATETQR